MNDFSSRCPLCDLQTKLVYKLPKNSGNEFGIVGCPNCGLLRALPIPEIESIKALYTERPPQDLFEEAEVFSSPLLTKLKDSLIISPLIKWVRSELSRADKPKLLDIGCATGWITAVARRFGFEAIGLEANPYLADVAREKYGLEVKEGFLEDLEISQVFDAVCMFHVLEHLTNPLGVLRKIRSILKANGVLLAVVPNGGSLGVSIFKRYYNWSLPHHVSFFTPRSIQIAYEKAGFKVLSLRHLPSPPILWYSFHNLMKSRSYLQKLFGFLKNPYVNNAVFTPPAFVGKWVKKGEVIAVLGRKV